MLIKHQDKKIQMWKDKKYGLDSISAIRCSFWDPSNHSLHVLFADGASETPDSMGEPGLGIVLLWGLILLCQSCCDGSEEPWELQIN